MRLIVASAPRLPAETLTVSAALSGRVLAEGVTAVSSLPPFDVSAMDGYAARREELGAGPLPVAARIAAGSDPSPLAPGTAAEISTGAAVPAGADAIVPVEDARETDAGLVAEPPRGDFIRRAGGDLRAGDEVAGAGRALSPALLSAIAAAGVSRITVAARPRLAVIATGSELAPPGQPLRPGQIHESNSVGLAALAARAGAEVLPAVRVADDPAATREAFETALELADVVVSSGGVSVGRHDHVKPVLAELGVREVFWRIAHKPGKPLWFGVAPGGGLVFGLPGNPVSSLVCFGLFVRPALRAMQGAPPTERPVARLAQPVRRLAERDHAMRCGLRPGPEGMELVPQAAQDSHLIAHAASAAAIALIPAGTGELPAGTLVEYVPV